MELSARAAVGAVRRFSSWPPTIQCHYWLCKASRQLVSECLKDRFEDRALESLECPNLCPDSRSGSPIRLERTETRAWSSSAPTGSWRQLLTCHLQRFLLQEGFAVRCWAEEAGLLDSLGFVGERLPNFAAAVEEPRRVELVA